MYFIIGHSLQGYLAWDGRAQWVRHLSRQCPYRGCAHWRLMLPLRGYESFPSPLADRLFPAIRSALPFPFSPKRNKQRSSGSFSTGSSGVMSAQCPLDLPSPRPFVSPVCFTQEDQCPSLVADGEVPAESLKSFPLLRLRGRSRTTNSSASCQRR